MLLTITTTRHPATDLSYMLHKHPGKVQSTDIKNGKAHIFYPEASEVRCTCALLLDIDPVGLVRGNNGPSGDAFALEQYVNDRPYVASSFMSTAIAKAFSTALNGKCKDKPELADKPIPLEAKLAVLPVKGGLTLLEKIFLPLGYRIEATQHPLDIQFPEWGASRYFTVTLYHTLTLKELLAHLYVLIPVLDNDKHYWITEEEVSKLMDKGKGWLEQHPDRELIVRRYLKKKKSMANEALAILMKEEVAEEEATTLIQEPAPGLHQQRLQMVCNALVQSGAQKVLDLGCGEGKLLRLLMQQQQFQKIAGMDVSVRPLEIAAGKLKLSQLPERQQQRIQLFQGSLTYRDKRLEGYDAAALVEVIEHLDADRLFTLEKNVFRYAAPDTVVITTPNKEWNVTFTDDATQMRHSDHRFEWTRREFEAWCLHIQTQYQYRFIIQPIGEETEGIGAPSQMAIFSRQ